MTCARRRAGAARAAARPAGTTAVAPARQAGDQLGLGRGDGLDRCRAARGEPGRSFTITPTSGSAIAASSAIWPAPRIAISSTSTSVPAGALRISSGSPISVLKLAREATVPPVGREQRAEEVLRRGLAGRAGDPDHAARRARAARRWRGAAAISSGSSAARTTPVRRRPTLLGVLARDQHAPGPGLERLGREACRRRRSRPEGRRTARRARVARVDRDDARGRRACRARRRARRRPPTRPSRVSMLHLAGVAALEPLPAGSHARRSRRRTGSSAASNSCPCSCPLPAITTTSPGSAAGDGLRRCASGGRRRARPRGPCRRGSRR